MSKRSLTGGKENHQTRAPGVSEQNSWWPSRVGAFHRHQQTGCFQKGVWYASSIFKRSTYIYIHNTHIYIYFIIIFYSIPPKYPKIINTQHLCHKSLDHVSPSEERKPALRSPTDPNRISGARYQTVTTSVTPVTCCFNMFELCKNMDPPVDLDWSCIYICYIYLQHEISIPDLSVSKPSSSTSSAASWVYFGIGTWVAWRSCGTAAKIRQARLLGAPPRRL